MRDRKDSLPDVNLYTIVLFTAGVYALFGYILHFDPSHWREFSLLTALVIFVELTPVKLPSGTSYSAAVIGVTYLLLKVSFSAAMFSLLLSTFAFNVKVHRGVRGIKWFRFFVSLGMYFLGYLMTWIFAQYSRGVSDFFVALIATAIGEGTNAILLAGIAASFGNSFWSVLGKRIPELWLPTLVSGFVLFRLLIVHTMEQLAMEVIYSAMFLAIVLFFSSEYLKQITFRDRRLEENHQQYKSLFDFNPDLVCSLDLDGVIQSSNPAGEVILGYQFTEFVGREFAELCVEEDERELNDKLARTIDGNPQNFEIRLVHSNRRVVDANITTGPTVVNGEIVGAYLIVKDITERRESERTITQMAFYDPLTSLLNRRLFHHRLDEALVEAKDLGHKVGLMLLDLNRFKLINDSFGHTFGDHLLVHIAERLTDTIGDVGEIARMGGDEFLVLVKHTESTQGLSEQAERILKRIEEPIEIESREFRVSASIGIAIYPDDSQNADSLIRSADVAMYRAKLNGINSYSFYAAHMKNEMEQELEVENALRRALHEQQFVVYYQPQYNIQTKRVIGVEALVRWNHPQQGLVGPSHFIGIAERTGLITDIGYHVLREACRQNVRWQRAGLAPMTVSVNLSLRQFQKDTLYQDVIRILEEEEMHATWLNLEITESTLAHDIEAAIRILMMLKTRGIQVSIDDFGTGYSSLSYLRKMPLDHLKIDGTFIHEMTSSSGDTTIVKTIIELGHQMGMRVVAEGVETSEHLQLLQMLGCDEYQGYFGSPPVSAQQVEEILQLDEIAVSWEDE